VFARLMRERARTGVLRGRLGQAAVGAVEHTAATARAAAGTTGTRLSCFVRAS